MEFELRIEKTQKLLTPRKIFGILLNRNEYKIIKKIQGIKWNLDYIKWKQRLNKETCKVTISQQKCSNIKRKTRSSNSFSFLVILTRGGSVLLWRFKLDDMKHKLQRSAFHSKKWKLIPKILYHERRNRNCEV